MTKNFGRVLPLDVISHWFFKPAKERVWAKSYFWAVNILSGQKINGNAWKQKLRGESFLRPDTRRLDCFMGCVNICEKWLKNLRGAKIWTKIWGGVKIFLNFPKFTLILLCFLGGGLINFPPLRKYSNWLGIVHILWLNIATLWRPYDLVARWLFYFTTRQVRWLNFIEGD